MVEEYQAHGFDGSCGDLLTVPVHWYGLRIACMVEMHWPQEVGVNFAFYDGIDLIHIHDLSADFWLAL